MDDLGRQAIAQIDKILKGARAADLPIERPTKFRLVVNLKTAKAVWSFDSSVARVTRG